MNNKRKAPIGAVTPSEGIKRNAYNNDNTFSFSDQTKKDAQNAADTLIKLQQQFPNFFRDIKPDDPDLDMEKGFETLEKMRFGHGK